MVAVLGTAVIALGSIGCASLESNRVDRYDERMAERRAALAAADAQDSTEKKTGYSSDVYTDEALAWLKTRDAKKPFLLCLQFKAPHHDYSYANKHQHPFAYNDSYTN